MRLFRGDGKRVPGPAADRSAAPAPLGPCARRPSWRCGTRSHPRRAARSSESGSRSIPWSRIQQRGAAELVEHDHHDRRSVAAAGAGPGVRRLRQHQIGDRGQQQEVAEQQQRRRREHRERPPECRSSGRTPAAVAVPISIARAIRTAAARADDVREHLEGERRRKDRDEARRCSGAPRRTAGGRRALRPPSGPLAGSGSTRTRRPRCPRRCCAEPRRTPASRPAPRTAAGRTRRPTDGEVEPRDAELPHRGVTPQCGRRPPSTNSRPYPRVGGDPGAAPGVIFRARGVKRQRMFRNARVLIAVVSTVVAAAASPPAPQVLGRRPPRRPSIRGCRRSPRAGSARPTSSTRPGATPTSARRRTARAPARPPTPTAACRLAAARHLGRGHRRVAPRHARLQLVADDAGERRVERRRLRLQRPGAGEDRPGRRRQGQPVGARLRRARPASAAPRRPAPTCTRTATRRCASASRS